MSRARELRDRFRRFHTDPPVEPTPGVLVVPNPWDLGSAKLLVELGAVALATTSAGFAGTAGRLDQHLRRDDVIDHARALAAAVDVPLTVDAEDGYGDDPAAVADTVRLLADAGAAGCSIEDYDARRGEVRALDDAAHRVAAAVEAADGMVVTARAEQHLYGSGDLDDTIVRLRAYRSVGADVVYAPGLVDEADIGRLVDAVEAPVNVLALPGTPPIPRLAELGVARVSTGSLLAWAAYGTLVGAARELFGPGTSAYAAHALPQALRDRAFG